MTSISGGMISRIKWKINIFYENVTLLRRFQTMESLVLASQRIVIIIFAFLEHRTDPLGIVLVTSIKEIIIFIVIEIK